MPTLNPADESLAQAIHAWVHLEIADDDLVDRMTQLAISFRESGASIAETCEWVQHLVTSWVRHPSTTGSDPQRLHLVPATAVAVR